VSTSLRGSGRAVRRPPASAAGSVTGRRDRSPLEGPAFAAHRPRRRRLFTSNGPVTTISRKSSDATSTVLYATDDPSASRVGAAATAFGDRLDGVEVVPVTGVESCRDALDERTLAVVTEADLDGETGVDLVAAVRSAAPSVPVVFVAGDLPADLVAAAYEAGASTTLRYDGADAEVLAETVRGTLGREADGRRSFERERTRYEAMTDAVSDGIYALDGDDRFIAVNDAYCDLVGIDRGQLLGEPATTVTDRLAGDDVAVLRRALEGDDEVISFETTFPTPGGEPIPVEARITPFVVGPDETGRVGVVRDISERRELEHELEGVLERITDAFFALDEDWAFTYVNERAAELLQRPPEELLGEVVWEEFSAAVGTTFEAEYERAMSTGESVTFEEFYPPLETWFEVSAYPSETGLSVYFRDVTARKRAEERREERTRRFEALNERARRLAEAETREAVCETTVAAASEVLDLPRSAVALYDRDAGSLRVAAATDAAAPLVDGSLLTDSSGPVWEAFVRDEQTVTEVDLDGPADAEPWTAVVVPLGEHGVFVALVAGEDPVAETGLLVAELLCANARSSLDRAAREADLRRQRDRLEEKNDSLQRVNRINRAIRDITQVLIRAESRSEVERLICEKLAAIDPFRFVWMSEFDATDGALDPVAAAGEGQDYLEEVTVTADDSSTGQGPAGRAVRSRTPQVQNSILEAPSFEPWREAALSREFRSCVAVPVEHRETLYGVLNIYATTPMAFEDMEVAVLEELGQIIGYALSAIERKRALVSESSVELTFSVPTLDAPLFGFVDGSEGTFELENTVRRLDGRTHLFLTARGVPFERIREHATGSPDVERVTLVSEDDGECLFECTVRDSTFVSTVLERGAVLDGLSVADGTAELTFRIPRSAGVREFVGGVSSAFGRAELVARHEVDDPVMTRGEFESEVRSRLTERQEEVIRTAHFAGFFDWPRKSNGQEVAEMLGVTQPTVNRHVRAGERTLFGLLFDG
jgi:PAS domain S-box-containing protein